MIKYLLTGLTLIAGMVFQSLFAQSYNESFKILNQEAIRNSIVDERVMLLTDRDIYLCGENIVFSAYLYEGNWFMPLSNNSVLYVELYDQSNNVVKRNRYPLINGKSSGLVEIPKTVASNIYFIRAYTGYMKNFGLGQFFTRRLRIVNPFFGYSRDSLTPPDPETIVTHIWPEGGKLINGIRSRVGCRFTDSDGAGIEVIARIVDAESNIIGNFRSCENGFAEFEFLPETGVEYTVEVAGLHTGSEVPVPKRLNSGSTFSVDTVSSGLLKVNILSNETTDFPLSMTARRGDFIYPLDKSITTPGYYEMGMEGIPSGLLLLQLTGSSGNILADRFIYHQLPGNLVLGLKTDKTVYTHREEVQTDVVVSGNSGLPAKADLLFFAAIAGNDCQTNGLPHHESYLISQELRQILSHDEYLIPKLATDYDLLDLLLLTTPAPVTGKGSNPARSIVYSREDAGNIIRGRVFHNNVPAAGLEVLQSYVGGGTWIESAFTNENGEFVFIDRKQGIKGDLVLKVKNAPGITSLMLDDGFSTDFPAPGNEILRFTRDELELISDKFINIQVDDAYRDITIMPAGGQERIEDPFYGRDYTEFIFDDYIRLPNMEEFIFEVIFGVNLSRRGDAYEIFVLEENTNTRIGREPLIIIDGIPVDDPSVVVNLPPGEVKSARLIRYRYFYKQQSFDGILDIITHSNDASAFSLPSNTFRFDFEPLIYGVSDTRFLTEDDGRVPLYRNYIYSNPDKVSDPDGNASFTFTAPDNAGTFRIFCFARDEQGNIGSVSRNIEVMK